MRCLIVDDDGLARLVLERFLSTDPTLELAGTCGTLAEARAALAEAHVDLVFLDDDLPDGSGLDFLRRSEGTLPPTILVTGAPAVADSAVEAGAVAAITKPISLAAFREAIARAS